MTGVCGTDKHIFKGEASQIRGKSIFPYIGGHEVIEVGNWVDTGKTVPLNVMQHVASKNIHIHSVFHCGTNWRPVLKLLQKFRELYPFDSLISHRMSLAELVAGMEVVTNPNECVKVEVVPHAN